MFGLFGGPGKIEVQLNNFNYAPGDTIEGTVALKMDKAAKAKGLSIMLLGELIPLRPGKHGNNRKIFEFSQPLDGEKDYQPSPEPAVYPFKIVIPQGVLKGTQLPDVGGTAGDVLKAATFLSGAGTRTSWSLIAKLDIPMGGDVSKKVQINIA